MTCVVALREVRVQTDDFDVLRNALRPVVRRDADDANRRRS